MKNKLKGKTCQHCEWWEFREIQGAQYKGDAYKLGYCKNKDLPFYLFAIGNFEKTGKMKSLSYLTRNVFACKLWKEKR